MNPHDNHIEILRGPVEGEQDLAFIVGKAFERVPGILSDTEITQLCVLPDEVFDEITFNRMLLSYKQANPHLNVWPTPQSVLDQIEAQTKDLRAECTHKVTQKHRDDFVPMISDFSPELIREIDGRKIISKGLTSFGYDVSLREDFKLFTNANAGLIDPKKGGEDCLVDANVYEDELGAKYVILPPNSYILGATHEYFTIPRDVMVVCVGKSTYARAGAIVNTTPIEPGFEGNVVIEIANATSSPMKIYIGEGISQFIFFRGNRACQTSYGDRGGKYQGQTGVTLGKV